MSNKTNAEKKEAAERGKKRPEPLRHGEREKRRLRRFYLLQLVLFSVFVLFLGLFYAREESERKWHGTGSETIGPAQAEAWLDEQIGKIASHIDFHALTGE